MKTIAISEDGELTTKDLNYFGGKYSFWEKVRKKGTGSPKIIYEEGIEEFDKLRRNIEGEVGFVNFELLRNGLILRLNLNKRFGCIGVKMADLSEINLVAYRIKVKQRRLGRMETKIFHRGELELIETNEISRFSVVTREFESIKQYFEKGELRSKFKFSTSTNPPEKDYSHLLNLFGIFS